MVTATVRGNDPTYTACWASLWLDLGSQRLRIWSLGSFRVMRPVFMFATLRAQGLDSWGADECGLEVEI